MAPFEKVRGKSKALRRIRELCSDYGQKQPNRKLRVGISNADNLDGAVKLAAELSEFLDLDGEVMIGDIGPTIGVHTGPGAVALFLYAV